MMPPAGDDALAVGPAEAAEPTEPTEPTEPAAEAAEPLEAPEAEVDPLAALDAEVADLKDQLLRALAEVENVRRRGQREREESLKYATAPLITDLLAVADNLSRALQSLPANDVEENQLLKPLIEGITLTQKELLAVFARHGILQIEPLGERLDPHRHEALFEIEDPAKPAGTVVQVVQPGYLLHQRLLRPARVAVAKGGAPAQTEDETAAEPSAEPKAEPAPKDDQPPEPPGSNLDTEA